MKCFIVMNDHHNIVGVFGSQEILSDMLKVKYNYLVVMEMDLPLKTYMKREAYDISVEEGKIRTVLRTKAKLRPNEVRVEIGNSLVITVAQTRDEEYAKKLALDNYNEYKDLLQ